MSNRPLVTVVDDAYQQAFGPEGILEDYVPLLDYEALKGSLAKNGVEHLAIEAVRLAQVDSAPTPSETGQGHLLNIGFTASLLNNQHYMLPIKRHAQRSSTDIEAIAELTIGQRFTQDLELDINQAILSSIHVLRDTTAEETNKALRNPRVGRLDHIPPSSRLNMARIYGPLSVFASQSLLLDLGAARTDRLLASVAIGTYIVHAGFKGASSQQLRKITPREAQKQLKNPDPVIVFAKKEEQMSTSVDG